MRKILISILLASAAASPALAQDHHDRGHRDEQQQSERQQAREQRQQAREDRQQAREPARQERSIERPQFQVRQQQEVREQSFDRARASAVARANSADVEQVRQARQRADGTSRWNRDNVQQAGETSRWTRDPNQRSGETGRWTRDRTGWTGSRDANDQQRQYQYQQQHEQQQQVSHRSRWSNGGWNRNWRSDRRYDWRTYRNSHRSVFHVGVYVDPFNYGYRSYNIGYRLQPLYFSQQYWFDPAMYGLPYPPPGTQWIRYWNDALLVDMYSGEVVDVIQNFFW